MITKVFILHIPSNKNLGLRNVLCVDGNDTPVSLSEGETGNGNSATAAAASLTKPVFTSPAKTSDSKIRSPLKSPLKSLTNTFHR